MPARAKHPPRATIAALDPDAVRMRGAPLVIVGVGASAGGLEAFSELLSHLPIDTGMAFVLVQHLDPQHESALTQLLARVTAMPVREVSDHVAVEANHVYVIPPNTDLLLEAGALRLQPRPDTRAPHRSIDFFFATLAREQRERAVGVILSGTATDGTVGLEAIKAEGGITFAQDASARYDSMPRSAVAAGCVDFELSPTRIARELARIATYPALPAGDDDASAATAGEPAEASPPAPIPDGAFAPILLLLRHHSGVDFTQYKASTVQRRILRRMILTRHRLPDDYTAFLRGNVQELDALFHDALIGVTSFFRNPDAFDVLTRTVAPALLQAQSDQPIRVWVPGCSAGQEAYSIAMAFAEAGDALPRRRQLQVFATDLNDRLLDSARRGLYPTSVAQDLSPERLRRFFVEEDGGYRVTKSLRSTVVFAVQNMLSDPPFSRLDLISCRNVLIYFGTGPQKRIFPQFHYSLRAGGFLFLGASESVGGFTELFDAVDKKQRIYRKKPTATPTFRLPARRDAAVRPGASKTSSVPADMKAAPMTSESDPQREADRLTVHRFAPPAVLVNDDLQVLQFRGATGAYLEPPTGRATFDLLKMARGGLVAPLRAAIVKARKQQEPVRKDGIRLEQEGRLRTVRVEVVPLRNLQERCFLILFQESNGALSDPSPPTATRRGRGAAEKRMAELQAELTDTRDYLQAMHEQHQAATEELQTSNEEVQSANEELQSLNEELETSKEELESANEELVTVNEEMAFRNAELNRVNSDLVNIQSSAHLAIVLLGRDLRVRRFSAQAERLLGLTAADVGRPIGQVKHDLAWPDADAIIAQVIDSGQPRESEVRDARGKWYSFRVRPYVTLDRVVDGAVLVFVDIDDLKRSEQRLLAARDYETSLIEAVLNGVPLGVYMVDQDFRIRHVNPLSAHVFGDIPDLVGRDFDEVVHRLWPPAFADDIVRRFRHTLDTGEPDIVPERTEERRDRGVTESYTWQLHRIHLPDGGFGVVCYFRDISAEVRTREALAESDRRKNEFLAILAHELRNPLAPILVSLDLIRHAKSTDPALVDHGLDVARRQVGHMVRLADDLLDVGRISRGKIDLRRERLDLVPIVDQVAEASRQTFERQQQSLVVELWPTPIYMSIDPVRVTQIVGNLLNNASKFTPRGGEVRLVMAVVAHPSPQPESVWESVVEIRVSDSGIGLAAAHLTSIFELFTQVDTSLERTQAAGLGIGLTLVKTLTEMHGGAVSVTSGGRDQGSEFVIRLPFVDSRERPAAGEPVAASEATPRRILIVDDNHDGADSLAMMLALNGHETHVEYNGLSAVEAATSFRPDIVLMDIGLPGLNGYDAARRIRALTLDGRPRPLLVALTGWGQPDDHRRSTEAGFDAHVVKPIDEATLRQILATSGGAAGRP